MYKFIPNELYNVLQDCKKLGIAELKSKHKVDEGLDLYLDKLIDEDWGFITQNPESFPEISTKWTTNTHLSTAIISYSNRLLPLLEGINLQLTDLICQALQIRFFEELKFDKLIEVISSFDKSTMVHFELVLKYNKALLSDENIYFLLEKDSRIKSIVVHSSPKNEVEHKKFMGIGSCFIYYKERKIVNNDCCGSISEESFSPNLGSYIESQEHNTCLNRKVSIDEEGEIKICPSMPFSYGNVSTTRIKEIISLSEYRKWWKLKKDDIKICQDCEFRYICSDCRISNFEDDKIYDKPVKCNYDPYQAKWL